MVALIAARDLKRAAGSRELSDVDVLDVRTIHAEGDGILRLAGGGAGVAADANRLIDDLPPLDRFGHVRKVSLSAQRDSAFWSQPSPLILSTLVAYAVHHSDSSTPRGSIVTVM